MEGSLTYAYIPEADATTTVPGLLKKQFFYSTDQSSRDRQKLEDDNGLFSLAWS
jgi:hypothetical protein